MIFYSFVSLFISAVQWIKTPLIKIWAEKFGIFLQIIYTLWNPVPSVYVKSASPNINKYIHDYRAVYHSDDSSCIIKRCLG